MSKLMAQLPHALVLIVLAVILHPTEVQARSVTDSDPRGDLVNIWALSYDEGGVPETSPRQAKGDIVSVRLRHRTNRIRVRVTFAELRRAGTTGFFGVLGVRTNEGIRRQVWFSTSREFNWKQETYMQRPSGMTVRCPIHHTLDSVNDMLVLGIPRACVSRPRWVQMSFHSHLSVELVEDKGRSYKDDALRDGLRADDSQFPTRYKLSPRIYRGAGGPSPSKAH